MLVLPAATSRFRFRELATIQMLNGPAMIRNEDGLLTGYVFVDLADSSPGDYVTQARRELQNKLQLPAGYTVLWSGQYESAERVRQRLLLVVPVTLAIILFLLYCNTRSIVKTAIIIAGGSVLRCGRLVDGLPARLQHEYRRVGGHHRAAGHRC